MHRCTLYWGECLSWSLKSSNKVAIETGFPYIPTINVKKVYGEGELIQEGQLFDILGMSNKIVYYYFNNIYMLAVQFL